MSVITDYLKGKETVPVDPNVPPAAPDPNAPPAPKGPENPPADTPVIPEMNDDLVKKFLKEKHNISIDNLVDLKLPPKPLTEEEQKVKDAKLKDDAIKFAIKNDKFTTDDFASYSRDSQAKPDDIAFDILKAKWLKDEPTLDEKDLRERFTEYFKLDDAENTWARVERSKELNDIVQGYFKAKYPNIVGSTDEYVQHLKDISDADVYNKQVETAFSSLPTKLSFELELPGIEGAAPEKKTYEFSYSAETIAEVKKNLLDPASFSAMRGSEQEKINLAIELAILKKENVNMVTAIAKEHGANIALASKAGRKSIPVTNPVNDTKPKGTEDQASSGVIGQYIKGKK